MKNVIFNPFLWNDNNVVHYYLSNRINSFYFLNLEITSSSSLSSQVVQVIRKHLKSAFYLLKFFRILNSAQPWGALSAARKNKTESQKSSRQLKEEDLKCNFISKDGCWSKEEIVCYTNNRKVWNATKKDNIYWQERIVTWTWSRGRLSTTWFITSQ